MRVFKKSFLLKSAVLMGFCTGFYACGSDSPSESSPGDSPIAEQPVSSADVLVEGSSESIPSSAEPGTNASSATGDVGKSSALTPKSSSSTQKPAVSSSSKKTETVSSEEILNEPTNLVNGKCGPQSPIVERDSMASWVFTRSSGDVFDQILAPFVWTFDDGKSLQGNGLSTVNLRYSKSGVVTAQLSVDGNTITCSPLQVQGEPITISSCKADKAAAKPGDVITWNVVAESKSPIISYDWSTDFEGVSITGTGASASLTATSAMHKKKVASKVVVTNEDKTVQTYACEGVGVVDPDQVDIVLSKSASDSSKAFPTAQTVVVQYPSDAVNCQMICGAQSDGVLLDIDGEEYTIDYSLNISPKGCKDGAAAGTKMSVTASMRVLCYVAY